MFLLAWRNITRRKSQTLITVIITALTIGTFVLAQAIFVNLQEGMRLSSTRLGADVIVLPHSVKADAYQTIFTGEPENVYMPETILASVRQVDGVQKATPQFFTQTLSESCCSLAEPNRLVGYDQVTDFVVGPWLRGENKSQGPSANEVIVGAGVSPFLGGTAAILGSTFKEAGRLERTGTGMDDTIFLRLDVARELAKNSPYLKDLWQETPPDQQISSILVKVKEGINPTWVADRINNLDLEVNAVTTSKVITNARGQMNAVYTVLAFLWAALGLTATLALVGRFTALAKERKRELGMLRAIGGQRGDIIRVILFEALLTVSAGGVLGTLVGALLTQPVLSWFRSILNLSHASVSMSTMILQSVSGLAVAVILGVGAALYPAIRSSRLDPQEVISRGELD